MVANTSDNNFRLQVLNTSSVFATDSTLESATSGGTVITIDQSITNTWARVFTVGTGTTLNNATIKPMLTVASDSGFPYEPYKGTTTTVDLGQTVYSGSLNVTTGVLTIDYGLANFSNGDWSIAGNPLSTYLNHYVYEQNSLGGVIEPNQSNEITKAICSYLPSTSRSLMGSSSTETIGIFQYHQGTTNRLRISFPRESQYSTSANVMEWINSLSEPFVIAYPLKDKITVQLTPTQVNTLLGQNNVWADSGDVEVTYKANASLTIEEIINAITSLGGNV